MMIGRLLLFFSITASHAAIIPPPWSNPHQNPCATMPGGWQLLYWVPLRRCFKIFTLGFPCPDTMELSPTFTTARRTRLSATNTVPIAECRCPPGTSFSSLNDKCYQNFELGPCDKGEYFSPITEELTLSKRSNNRLGICREVRKCPDDTLIFWPKDGKCYKKLTRGPCTKGKLLVLSTDGFGECKCESDGILSTYFYKEDETCHEHFTKGSCLLGQLFLPDGRCDCSSHLPHYHEEMEMCFELNSPGPCPEGHIFRLPDNETTSYHAKCQCKDNYTLWADGKCYRLFTRGPCAPNEFLINGTTCVPNLCSKGQLYFPQEKSCYRIGSQGPCDLYQVVVFDFTARPSVDGISYNGICGCSGIISNLDEQCSNSEPVGSNTCKSSPGMVDINGICYQLYSRGPCGPGQWLQPLKYNLHSNDTSLDQTAECTCRPGYILEQNAITSRCNAPNVELAKYLSSHQRFSNKTAYIA